MTTTADAQATTGVLQMLRAEVNVRNFQRWMGTRRLQDPDHAMHCLLTECFGKPPTKENPGNIGLAPRPFRLIIPRSAATGVLYGYGQADADAMRDAAAICADPLQSRIMPAESIDSKPMPDQWQAGKRLGFEIRIRPIVRAYPDPSDDRRIPAHLKARFKERDIRPGAECDAFLWEAIKHPERGGMKRTREKVYAEWLSGQFDHRRCAQVDLERTKLVSFQRTRAVRKLHRRHSEGPDAVMRGVLTITDPDAFAVALREGIGRHRAYGYGMLLLRPARE